MKLFLKVVLGILGFFAVVGVVGTFIMIIRDTNKMPPRPDKRADALLADLGIQGNFSLAIMRNPHKTYTEEFARGETDPDRRNNHRIFTRHFPEGQVDDNTIYSMDGIEEQFAMLAVMMLHDREVLNIDEHVSSYMDLPQSFQPVMLRHLLDHTSGLATGTDDYTAGPIGVPGDTAAWSPANVRLMEDTVAAVMKRPYVDFVREEIIEPLDMEHTTWEQGESQRGIWKTSTEDMLRWDLMLSSNRLVLFKTMKEAFFRAKLNDGSRVDHGFGWSIKPHRRLRLEQNLAPDRGVHLTRFSEKSFIVVILTEDRHLDLHDIGRRIGEIYLQREMRPQPVFSDQ